MGRYNTILNIQLSLWQCSECPVASCHTTNRVLFSVGLSSSQATPNRLIFVTLCVHNGDGLQHAVNPACIRQEVMNWSFEYQSTSINYLADDYSGAYLVLGTPDIELIVGLI